MDEGDVRGVSVAIATDDLESSIALFDKAFGLSPDSREIVESDGIEIATFKLAEGAEIQLLQPVADDSPVAGFLERNGPGIHHMGIFVESVADTLGRLAEAQIRTIGNEPRPGAGGRTVGFVHPKSTRGVLIELLEEAR